MVPGAKCELGWKERELGEQYGGLVGKSYGELGLEREKEIMKLTRTTMGELWWTWGLEREREREQL